ncbi:hypothetical protein G5C60_41995 [Streptomyces sp. HC44]|uniref:Uncharacterized protein n=1 Tax=Streptomyces scabichelini TaxID=2711217 RepID=A0A6G4VJF1_9ACTN|nr:hypothetical protein [Streptomyces scabichelini]NGO13995.1 hypothetical protein [Streptomyces scabichelini]
MTTIFFVGFAADSTTPRVKGVVTVGRELPSSTTVIDPVTSTSSKPFAADAVPPFPRASMVVAATVPARARRPE